MNANHELTAQIANMFAVLNLCHVSSEMFQSKMNKILFEVSTFFRSSTSPTAPVILKGLPTNSKPPLPSCKVNSQDIQTQTRVAQVASRQPISWLARKHERMAEGNLLIKFCLNRPLKSEPNASQNEKGQRHKLFHWLLQTTKPLTLE